jgi:hypothetical protein
VVRSFDLAWPVRSMMANTAVVQKARCTPTVIRAVMPSPITLPTSGSSISCTTTDTPTTIGRTVAYRATISRRQTGNSSGPIR